MKTKQQRINNIIGQLNGINRMLDNNENCEKIFIQLKSVQAAILSITDKMVEELDKCISNKNKIK
ncbi:metal-sensing transcriptional repressor [Patescibacteria group bacterium]|jgi:DNA-binding FrmR family transcriptional regulator|nr:metal-sensing transcriptional repressor [Patescibacteria group bacterium]